MRKSSGSPLINVHLRAVNFVRLLVGLFWILLFAACARKHAPESSDTSLYAITYYRGMDFTAEFVFLSILNPQHERIRVMKFLNEPQSTLSPRPAYGPQVEKNLTSWGISASKFIGKDSAYIREELFRDITTNRLELIYGDSTRQILDIKKPPYFRYIEKYRSDTTQISFWVNPMLE